MNMIIVILICMVVYDRIETLRMENIHARQAYKLQNLLDKVRTVRLETPNKEENLFLEQMESSIHFSADVLDSLNVWIILLFRNRVDVKLIDSYHPGFSDKNMVDASNLYKEYRQIISEMLHKRHYVLSIFCRRFIRQAVGHLF